MGGRLTPSFGLDRSDLSRLDGEMYVSMLHHQIQSERRKQTHKFWLVEDGSVVEVLLGSR